MPERGLGCVAAPDMLCVRTFGLRNMDINAVINSLTTSFLQIPTQSPAIHLGNRSHRYNCQEAAEKLVGMSRVKESELYFLVLHWLKDGPCRSAAEALQEELQQLSLLPRVPSIGPDCQPNYETLRRYFSHVPPSALRELVEECVHLQGDTCVQPSQALFSLLEANGSLSYIPSVRAQLAPSTASVPPPSCSPTFIQRLLQREAGYPRHPLSPCLLIDNLRSHVYQRLQHNKTLRGHRKAVYCVAINRQGNCLITGADDGVIKIWNFKLGLLKTTCRGHLAEITDLKINKTDALFASCSNDGTSRIWSLDAASLGHHVRAMIGHKNGVAFIAWHPTLTAALLSVSLDGTCRLWHALSGIEVIRLKPLGCPGHFYHRDAFRLPHERVLALQQQMQFLSDGHDLDIGLTCCAFSPTGYQIAISSRTGPCFLWHWNVEDWNPSDVTDATWPDVSSVIELSGHERCVPLLQFDHCGSALCGASSNGKVIIWKPAERCCQIGGSWKLCWSWTLPDPLPCPAYNHRRRRTQPECNQIAWSCNDQFLIAAYSCAVIMVWNVSDGSEENVLYGGHADSPIHVLEAHPLDPKICFSAGYDGKLNLWDIVNGWKIATLSSQDTHPGRWRWADAIQFVDGCFMHDGMGIVVSDVAGQVHLYGLDQSGDIIQRTPYDQFFLYDYDRVIIADDGEPVDMESGEPQHIHRTRFSMVDVTEEPYEPWMQEILLRGADLRQLPSPSDPPETPSSLLILPPTASAAQWLAEETGLGPQATATRVATAQQRQIALMQETGEIVEEVAALLPIPIEEFPDAPEIEIEEESGSEYAPDETEPINSPLATRRSERIQTRATEAAEPRRRRIPTRLNPGIPEMIEISEEDEAEYLELTEEEDTVVSEGEFLTSDEESIQEQPPIRIPCQARRLEPRRSTRRRRLNRVLCSPSSEENVPRRAVTSARSRRAARRAALAEASRQPSISIEPIDNNEEFSEGRSQSAYRWLSETRRSNGFYVPQVGDTVVFFVSLHRRFCADYPQIATLIDPEINFRFAEPCEVIDIKYEIFRRGPNPTVARVKLRTIDEGGIFEAVIPPPSLGHEEFLIRRRTFLDAVEREWILGERCKVFYFGDLEGERSGWWSGEIIEDTGDEVVDVWNCEDQYRRYRVHWTEYNTQPELLSPWELVDDRLRITEEGLDEATRQCFMAAIKRGREAPEAEHFRVTLESSASFPISGRTRQDLRRLFYNQVVALPMSLKLIQDRLRAPSHYASMAAFKHDVDLIVTNAQTFTEPDSEVSMQAEAVRRIVFDTIEEQSETPSETSSEEAPRRSLRHRSRERVVGDYQIRTRGMAKRERREHQYPYRRASRRRRLS